MSQSEIGWESLLNSDARAKYSLKAALLTTYDRPDERFLVEDLLPKLLKLDGQPLSEGDGGGGFLGKLDLRLKQLRDRFVVVSSTVREATTDGEDDTRSPYGWIWRSIRHLTVGSNGRAVQHAKLWLLHWKTPDDKDHSGQEFLEVVVSSANLTRSAFKNQIQSCWSTLVPLDAPPSKQQRNDWGVLPAFLRELAKSAGNEKMLDLFIKLLARAECRTDLTFVASVPGSHSSQTLEKTAWGSAGLKEIKPPGRGQISVFILSPFVGSWSKGTLGLWCKELERLPTNLKLVWIDKNHPWAEKWLLPAKTKDEFYTNESDSVSVRTSLLQMHPAKDATGAFHAEHMSQDTRWSHAKVYYFKRGRSRRMLVTSANFSRAAWGDRKDNGDLVIENFELGVCISQANWPMLERLAEFADPDSVATNEDMQTRETTWITWAQAEWDGKRVTIDCRCEARASLTVTVCGQRSIPISSSSWERTETVCHFRAKVPWDDSEDTPSWVELKCKEQAVRVPVFDERSLEARDATPPFGVDLSEAEAMRDAFLFEQYGGSVAGDQDNMKREGNEASTDAEDNKKGSSDSYAVPAFEMSRSHFGIVDNWVRQWDRIQQGAASDSDRKPLRDDGERLREAFKRQQIRDEKQGSPNSIGAKLAAEELDIRLKHFEEA